MPDNKEKTRPQDAKRINVNEDYELRYWSEKFGCTQEQFLPRFLNALGHSLPTLKPPWHRDDPPFGYDSASPGSLEIQTAGARAHQRCR